MKKILVVDDNVEYLHLLASVLQEQFQTYEAKGVADALKVLGTVTVDAICSDLNMKDGTGLDLLKILRREDMKIPFLLISGDDGIRISNEARSYGAAFCCKTDGRLIAKIQAMVSLEENKR